MLTNAIYFKGNWETQFDKAQTKNEDFYLSPAQTTKAPLMHREGSFSYFNGGTFQVLEIPYKSKELSHDYLSAQRSRRAVWLWNNR